ncbi:hypothetical protein N481_10040 [Pseudoalteromonas luteoviolacea S4047-1]|uniref:Uncharacterized protein n=1 Tax=Pseudoalteromonas luteoviolacea S4054 TaxID=1129367 RepID=A0A0F6AB24_9GAMM|nr:hypothetical protein N479_14445 [Pseudoalteromonas luteoviolacea S4054]KZN74045.1 hypothetical protein N481_10040 [Pseudoalteromonas luteoviolacea S4047-1]
MHSAFPNTDIPALKCATIVENAMCLLTMRENAE